MTGTGDPDARLEREETLERFHRDLEGHRSALADALTTRGGRALSRRAALLAAQRLVDRLAFLYFLVERGVVVPVTDAGKMAPEETGQVMSELASEHDDFWAVLRTICFDRMADRTADEVGFAGSRHLHVPYLGEQLFQPGTLATADGTVVSEEKLAVEGFDWHALVSTFNEYRWHADERGADGEAAAAGTLTPAIFGHVYEQFVVSVSQADDDIDPGDLDHAGNGHPDGNSERGAYYTGETIADFTARRAVWEGVLAKIDDDLAAGATPARLDPDELYRPGIDQSRAIEASQRDGFDALYETYEDAPAVRHYLDAKLENVRVCDPAVGSGAFVLAVANTLFEWRSACRPAADAYTLRREIVTRNTFGVDVLEGATETCKRRLWLWVASAVTTDTTRGRSVDDRDEALRLPDLSFNVRTGNSLLGVTELSAVSRQRDATGSTEHSTVEKVRQYAEQVREYRESADPESETGRELEDRHDELKRELDERYATAQRDPDGSPLSIVDRVDDSHAARDSLDAAQNPTLCVVVPDGIPDSLAEYLERRGFTTYTYRARLDEPALDEQVLSGVFDRLRRDVGGRDDWGVEVERAYAGRDFQADGLDACHWPLEFPDVFLDGGFDVVISNPPYGATLAPEAEPLVRSEANYDCQGASDSCEWFYERALDLIHDQGVLSYVVPKSVAFYSSWADIRGRLLEETKLKHVLDVGLGFAGVNLETIAIVATLGEGGESVPTVHRSADPKSATANRPVHLGWADQEIMLDAETIIFRPVTGEQRDVLDRLLAHGRRLGDVMSTDETTRQLYIPDRRKAELDDGNDHYVNKNPWVQAFYLEDIWHRDLDEYREAVEEYAVPRVMLKVLRGARLRAWLDPGGELVGTEKLVNVPLEESTREEIAFVYAALNHPCASFYLQKAVFSETTETARVMDGQYSKPIPLPSAPPTAEGSVAHLAWTLTLARQLEHDSNRNVPARSVLQSGLDALLGALYLGVHPGTVERWCGTLDETARDRARELFEAFYTERFATRDGNPEQYWAEIATITRETAETVAAWNTERVAESHEMAVVEDVL